MSKALDLWSAKARVALEILKSLKSPVVLSDTDVRRSADLKPYWKSENLETVSLLLLKERRDCIENVEHNYPILIDLSKGFDTTNCDLLLKIWRLLALPSMEWKLCEFL